jgi:16S rRNA (guanine527-N7)-methyltransferase
VQVQQSRVEDARGQYDCITARAFATLGEMLRLGGHLLAPDGIWIALKGRLSKEEILGVPAGFAVADVMVLTVPGLGAARQVAIIKRTNAQEQAA